MPSDGGAFTTALYHVFIAALFFLALCLFLSRVPAVRRLQAQHAAYLQAGEALLAKDRSVSLEEKEKEKELKAHAKAEKRIAAQPARLPGRARRRGAATDESNTAEVVGETPDSSASEDSDDSESEEQIFNRLSYYELRNDIFMGIAPQPTMMGNVIARARRLRLVCCQFFGVLNDEDLRAAVLLAWRHINKRFFAAYMLLMVLSGVFSALTVTTGGALLNVVTEAARGKVDAPASAAGIMLTLFSVSMAELAINALSSLCYTKMYTTAFIDMQRRYYRNILVQDAAFYHRFGDSNDLGHWARSDVSQVQKLVLQIPTKFLSGAIDLAIGAYMVLRLDPFIALVVIVARLPEALGLQALVQRTNVAYERLLKDDYESLHHAYYQSCSNPISVQNLAAEEFEVQRAFVTELRVRSVNEFKRIPDTVFEVLTTVFGSVQDYLRTVLLAGGVLSGRLSVGDYVNFSSFWNRTNQGISKLLEGVFLLREKQFTVKRFNALRKRKNANNISLRRYGDASGSRESALAEEFASATPSVGGGGGGGAVDVGSSPGFALSRAGVCLLLREDGSRMQHALKGAIEFADVTFSYPKPFATDKAIVGSWDARQKKERVLVTADSTGPNVLLHFSAKIPPGFRVGIVGPSGGGKSTLLRLLSRHYNPSAGKLLIDGMDSHCFSARHLRRCIGYVEQEPVLLRDRTVFENIAYGCEPPPSQAEVEEACRAAAIHDKIVGTADEPGWREAGGYAAKIGAKGLLPSGGEKQRLVIARAMVRKPTIMLLDESTSALDSENEKLVTEALERLMKGKTTIMIAHRLCTTQKCDLLLFMKKGRVVEHGTHLELCALKGEYYNFLKPQLIQTT